MINILHHTLDTVLTRTMANALQYMPKESLKFNDYQRKFASIHIFSSLAINKIDCNKSKMSA